MVTFLFLDPHSFKLDWIFAFADPVNYCAPCRSGQFKTVRGPCCLSFLMLQTLLFIAHPVVYGILEKRGPCCLLDPVFY